MEINFWTDTHAHIHDDEYGRSVDEFISLASDKNVKRIITIGIDYDDSIKALKTAELYDNIYAAVGMHPEYADKYIRDRDFDKFFELASNKKVIAVGETGLDFYYEENPDEKYQNILFQDMADIAGRLDKALVIHSRNAAQETIKILDEAIKKHSKLKGIFHCFDGKECVLDWIKDKNFYISYAGNVTFKNADNLRYALSNTPLDRLLIETDSPYLAPVPVRGKKNMPANVSYTGEYVAEFLNIPYNILQTCKETIYSKNIAYIIKETAVVSKGSYYILLENIFKDHTKEFLNMKDFNMDYFINKMAVYNLLSFNGRPFYNTQTNIKLEDIKCENNHTKINVINEKTMQPVSEFNINGRDFYITACLNKNNNSYFKYFMLYIKNNDVYTLYERLPVFSNFFSPFNQEYNNNQLIINYHNTRLTISDKLNDHTALVYNYMLYRKGTYLLNFAIKYDNNTEYIFKNTSEDKYIINSLNISLKLYKDMVEKYCKDNADTCKTMQIEKILPIFYGIK